jgi:hypothetical protein
VERLHPVALKQEVSVDIKVAAVVAADFNAELLLDLSLVQKFADITKSRIAEVAGILAFATDIINILEDMLAT